LRPGSARTVNSDLDPGEAFTVDKTFDQVSADDYDAVIVPGGTVGADKLRGEAAAVRFVRGIVEAGKPAGVICHGPWTLVEADVVRGRTLTSFPTPATDIRNAGGTWVDREVVVDLGLVTSRNPGDLPAFCARIVEEFADCPLQDRSLPSDREPRSRNAVVFCQHRLDVPPAPGCPPWRPTDIPDPAVLPGANSWQSGRTVQTRLEEMDFKR